tara:strand:+ start:2968 stop:4644 length:1677 start_codon:yes stop_codon:yes gene_type:complete
MAFNSFVGLLDSPTSDGLQSVSGLGFKPKAVILGSCGLTTSSVGDNLTFGYGMGTEDDNFSISVHSTNGGANSDTARRHAASALCVINNAVANVLIEANLDSMDPDGFTLDWTTSNATSREVGYMALGGDIEVSLDQIVEPTTAKKVSYTGPGFEPDFLIGYGIGTPTAPTAALAHNNYCLGFGTSPDNEGVVGMYAQDGQPSSVTRRVQDEETFLQIITASVGDSARIHSFDPSGYTLDWTIVAGASRYFVLAVRGDIQSKIVTFGADTSTGPQSITGAGFKPSALLIQSFGNVATEGVTNGTNVSVGFTDGDNQYSQLARDLNNQDTINSGRAQFNDRIGLNMNSSNTIVLDGNFTSFDSNGFTWNMDTAPGSATSMMALMLGPSDNLGLTASEVPFGSNMVQSLVKSTGVARLGVNRIVGATLSETKLVLGGFELSLFLDATTGVHALGYIDEATFTEGTDTFFLNGVEFEAVIVDNKLVMIVQEIFGEGSTIVDNTVIQGIPIGLNASNSLAIAEFTTEASVDETAEVMVAGTPLTVKRYGTNWFLSLAVYDSS